MLTVTKPYTLWCQLADTDAIKTRIRQKDRGPLPDRRSADWTKRLMKRIHLPPILASVRYRAHPATTAYRISFPHLPARTNPRL